MNSNESNWSRRNFIQRTGGGLPTLSFLLQQTGTASAIKAAKKPQNVSEKFVPIDLSAHFTATPAEFGPRERARGMSRGDLDSGLIPMPRGKQVFRGIPFFLGPEDAARKSWIALSSRPASWATRGVEIPLGRKAGFVCLAQFCDWDSNERPAPGQDVLERVGPLLAEAVFVYGDGSQERLPSRRRFEVNSPSIGWRHLSFLALPHRGEVATRLDDPLQNAQWWGDLQTGVAGDPAVDSPATLWLCALANRRPDWSLKALRFESRDVDPVVICGLTLFEGRENPLRYERLSLYRITLPEASAGEQERWQVSVDLGVVARTYAGRAFEPESWLMQPRIGLGDDIGQAHNRYLFAQLAAGSEGMLWIEDTKYGKRYQFELSKVIAGRELPAQAGGPRVEILEREKVWLHGRVLDTSTQRPTPVRLAFRSKDGRYIPPYGHRTEVNNAWFQDYGADVKWHETSFAVIDGTFQIELPVGEVYLELTKGFEYKGARRKLTITSNQRELNLEISPMVNFRSQGWVSADTHVHFLSPSTAILEGQAEGLNLVNLLSAQWGDLFTN